VFFYFHSSLGQVITGNFECLPESMNLYKEGKVLLTHMAVCKSFDPTETSFFLSEFAEQGRNGKG